MKMHPYLTFDGQCEAAFKFYEQCLGGTNLDVRTFAGSPAEEHVPAAMRDKVLHASLQVGDQVLMGSDGPPERFVAMSGFWVSLHPTDPAEAERVFEALAEGGTVTMPLAPTFWAKSFGMVTDRFGAPWMVNCG